MELNERQIILLSVIAILWLGGLNLIIINVIRKKKLFFGHILNPLIFLKFDVRDWAKILILLVMLVALLYWTISLSAK